MLIGARIVPSITSMPFAVILPRKGILPVNVSTDCHSIRPCSPSCLQMFASSVQSIVTCVRRASNSSQSILCRAS